MEATQSPSFFKKYGKLLFYASLVLFLGLGIFIKLYNLTYWEPFVALSFCGTMGLLLDFAWRNRKSLYAIPAVLLCAELLGIIFKNLSRRDVAAILFNLSSAVYPLVGLLFLAKAGKVWSQYRSAAWKLAVLGFLCILGAVWEYRMYLPEAAFGWIRYNLIYLGIFAMLLLIDFTEKLDTKGMAFEQGILRVGLLVITVKYFMDFVFV
ncbi:MAG: hypothetical protein H6581_25165 [Bacteroidia bacterium]|nr:hypothetical protein [Bacteroidia bacterium]